MARDYVRPNLSTDRLAEWEPRSVRLLINPNWDELRGAMQDLQTHFRKHVITESQLRALYEQSAQPEFVSAIQLTANYAPTYLRYDCAHSQAAACRLGPDLIGFILRRCKTPCGAPVDMPLYPLFLKHESYNPCLWLNGVLQAFWTRLNDDEVRGLQETCIRQMRQVQGRRLWSEERAWRARQLKRSKRQPLTPQTAQQRRQQREARATRLRLIAEALSREKKLKQDWDAFLLEWMEDMFRAGRPTPVSVLQDGCRAIADTLQAEGRDRIAWREIKQRWPSLTTKYHTYFETVIEGGALAREVLRNIRDSNFFNLSFGMWSGAQRTFDDPQVVFRVDAPELCTHLAYANQENRKAVHQLLQANCNPSHPAGGWSIGWLRVHKDDTNGILFVDEVQSDALESLRWNEMDIDPKAAALVERYLRRWHLFGFASVHNWANELGYRAAIHSEVSAALKAGMTASPRKWTTYYQAIIKHFGLKAEAISGYPGPIMVDPRRGAPSAMRHALASAATPGVDCMCQHAAA